MFGRKQPAPKRVEPSADSVSPAQADTGGYASSGLSPAAVWLEQGALGLAVGLDWRLCAQPAEQKALRRLWKQRGMPGRFEVGLPASALLMAPCPLQRANEGYSAAALLGLHLTQGIVVVSLASMSEHGPGFWVCRVAGGRPVPGCDVLLPDQAAAQALVAAWLEDSLQPITVYGDMPGAAMSAADLFVEIETALRTGLYSSKDLRPARLLRLAPVPGQRRVWLAVLPLCLLCGGLAYWWWSMAPVPSSEPLAAVSPPRTPSQAEQEAERQRLEQERVQRVRAELQKRFDADVQAAHVRLSERLQESWRAALLNASSAPLYAEGAQLQGHRCLRETQAWRCTYDWRSAYPLSRTRLMALGVQAPSSAASAWQQFSTARQLPQFPSWQSQSSWPEGLSDEHLPLWLADLFQGLRFTGAQLSPHTDEALTPANYQQDGVTLEGEPVIVARYHPLLLTVPLQRSDILYLMGALPLLVDEFELRAGVWSIKARLVGPLTLNP